MLFKTLVAYWSKDGVKDLVADEPKSLAYALKNDDVQVKIIEEDLADPDRDPHAPGNLTGNHDSVDALRRKHLQSTLTLQEETKRNNQIIQVMQTNSELRERLYSTALILRNLGREIAPHVDPRAVGEMVSFEVTPELKLQIEDARKDLSRVERLLGLRPSR